MTRYARHPSPTRQHWRIHGVSVQGYGHLRDGVECQDAYRHTVVETAGAQVLAVADGAGSRPRSAEGAALAVGLANGILAQRLQAGGAPREADSWLSLLTGAYQQIVSAFLRATEGMGPDHRDFAATLTAVVLSPPWLGIFSIGDGFVIARALGDDGRERFHLLSYAGPAGEYVNDAVFLTSNGALTHVKVDCLYDPDLTAVVLSTDGLVPAAIRQRDGRQWANDSFLEPVLGALDDPAEIARFLLEDDISRLSADDKTLLVAVAE